LKEPSNRSMVAIYHAKNSGTGNGNAKRILEALQMAHTSNNEEL
jgi:hypothetical protein